MILRYIVLFIYLSAPVLWPFYASAKQLVIPYSTTKIIKNIFPGEVVFFISQLDGAKRDVLIKFLQDFDGSKSPIFEFTRINPDKYYLNVHDFNSSFIINFSEKYHDSWKVYPVSLHGKLMDKKNSNLQGKYSILKNNFDYQASPKEVGHFIDRKWLRGQAGKPAEAFISKLFYKSIQNENLPKGTVLETMGKTSLADDYHVISNSFSNAWLVDYNYLAEVFPEAMVENFNDKFEIGFIIEFSHQKTLIISLVISGIFISAIIVVVLIKAGQMLRSTPE